MIAAPSSDESSPLFVKVKRSIVLCYITLYRYITLLHSEESTSCFFEMPNEEIFPPLPSQKPPDPPDSNMDTGIAPITAREKCDRMLFLEEQTNYVVDRLNFLNLTLARMNNGKLKKPKEDFERILKEKEHEESLVEHQKGELLSLGSCPIPDCQFHSNLNAVQIIKQNEEEALKLQLFLASNISNLKNNVNDKRTLLKLMKSKTRKPIVSRVSLRQLSWKQRDAGLGQRSGASCPPKPPKIPFIHLKFKNNYNLIMQEVTRKWPKSRSRLSGEYLKILASTADEHREITAFLTEKNEEFHAIDPIEVRPQKGVIKGLPISTDIDAIRADLTERGFNVLKVAQLTKAKSKFKLPIFMVDLKKLPGSPDIFQLETCCFLTVKIDSFNRRPGATQCYNCNLFHHSSSNCHIKTRCLKCGEPHKTGDCPIKSKIENPTCINCQQKGHLANSHRCPKFPKPKPKKGEASQNRNNKIVNNSNSNIFSTSSATVQKGVSFANALKNDKQMAPPLDKSEPAQSKPEATPNPP
ncbi:nucleic-acid-binding protein from transposon X-element [Trichonephila clavipes]|nr:nucleic-acid-binding protein from transposon X-element [Trichonephila clavipes]